MIRRPLALVLTVIAVHTAESQCAPAVLRQINQRQFEPARAQLETLLKRNAKDDAAMNCLGRLFLEKGEAESAVDWLEKAVAANGSSAQHHLWYGLALRAKGNQANMLTRMSVGQQMKAELEQAVRMDPTLVDARAVLLQIYLIAPSVMGGEGAAREQAAEMLKVNPVRGQMGYAAIAEQNKDAAAAEKAFLAAIAARPDSEVAYSAAGGFYRRQERWADAIAMYEKQLKAMSKDAPVARVSNAHYNLGLAQQKGGQPERAKAEFRAAIAANPDNENAKKALAAAP